MVKKDEKGSTSAGIAWSSRLLVRIDDSFFPVMETQLSDVYKLIGQRIWAAFFLRPLMDYTTIVLAGSPKLLT